LDKNNSFGGKWDQFYRYNFKPPIGMAISRTCFDLFYEHNIFQCLTLEQGREKDTKSHSTVTHFVHFSRSSL